MNSVIENRTPGVKTVRVSDMVYNRSERRNKTFVVIVNSEYVVLKKGTSPQQFDTVGQLELAGIFSYNNAMKICDKFIQANPTVKMIYRDSKTKELKLK